MQHLHGADPHPALKLRRLTCTHTSALPMQPGLLIAGCVQALPHSPSFISARSAADASIPLSSDRLAQVEFSMIAVHSLSHCIYFVQAAFPWA